MDDPTFMLLQLQQNLQFLRNGARVLTCLTYDKDKVPYWTYALVTYDEYGNVKEYHDPYDGYAEWSQDPIGSLKQLHLEVAGFVANRLIHECRPRLRTLAQQREDEAPINIASVSDSPPQDLRQGQQSPILQYPPQSSSDDSQTQTFDDAQPYQRQQLGPSHFPQPSPVLDSKTWPSNSTASRTKPVEKSTVIGKRPHQPQKLGPSHFPQPSPLLGSETWPSADLPSRVKPPGPVNKQRSHAFGTDEPSIHQQIQATTQRVQSVKSASDQSYDIFGDGDLSIYSQAHATAKRGKLRSTKSKLPDEELGLNPSTFQHTAEPAVSHDDSASVPHRGVDQLQQSRARHNLLGGNAERRETFTRSEAREAEELSPWIRSKYDNPVTSAFTTHNHPGLPEPLISHPRRGQPISIMVDDETYNLQHTDPAEFARRVNLAVRAMSEQAHLDSDPIARIEYEGQEYLDDKPRHVLPEAENHKDFDNYFNAFSQARDVERRTVSQAPLIDFPGSPESDKTVTPLDTAQSQNPLSRRRRSTHTRFDHEIDDAGLLDPSSRVPSYPAYPPTLSTSRSEATMPRNISASNEAIRRNFSASNETMRRNPPADDTEVSLGAVRPSQTRQVVRHEGEQVHVQVQQGGDVLHRWGQAVRVASRKVSESLGARRLSSVP